MTSLWERVREHPVTNTVVGYASVGIAFVQVHLWPVFSTGMVLGTVAIVAAAYEKQMIADHLFGGSHAAKRRDAEAVSNASELLDEESTIAVKRAVWHLPRSEFKHEYIARHGPELQFR